MALNDLQRFGEAQEAWEKALKINPDLKVAKVNLDALNGGPTGRGSINKHRKRIVHCCRRSRKSRLARSYGASPTETSTRYGVVRSYTKPSTSIGLAFGRVRRGRIGIWARSFCSQRPPAAC